MLDLVGRRPEKTDQSGPEDLPDRLRDLLVGLDWVADAQVRLREEGHRITLLNESQFWRLAALRR